MQPFESDAVISLARPELPEQRRVRLWPRLVASGLIATCVLIGDQITKVLAESYLTQIPEQSVPVIGNFFRLTYVANRGAAFGILQDRTLFFVLVGLVVIV